MQLLQFILGLAALIFIHELGHFAAARLLKVEVEDAMAADWVFHMLMGSEVPPRKSFIQAHAKSVKNLDI